jgi:uncharacterized protein
MEAFLDRDWELGWLRQGWESNKAEFRILYGRRRVGKSALLDEFARGKRCVLFQAVEGSTTDHLRDLTEAILACEEDRVLREAPLASWRAALAKLVEMAKHERVLVIIDEYQYAAEADRTLASLLQRWWSREAVHSSIYLVLCGSYVRFFLDNVLTGPAYGRNTGSVQLRPLTYLQAASFLEGWKAEDKLRAFAVTGGIPHYLAQLNAGRSLQWNIEHNVLERGAVLFQDAELLMREELREPRMYYSILRAISEGCTRISDIQQRALPDKRPNELNPYLAMLQELNLAHLSQPVASNTARRGVWAIADPYLRFWFRFVLPNRVHLEHGVDPAQVYRSAVGPRLDHFVSKPLFEEVCRQWLLDRMAAGDLPTADKVGAWWGPIPAPVPDNRRRQAEAEVDVVAVKAGRVVLAGEAKWTAEPVGFAVLNHLREVVHHVPGADEQTQLMLFGRRFDPRLAEAARAEGIRLVSVDELYAPASAAVS